MRSFTLLSAMCSVAFGSPVPQAAGATGAAPSQTTPPTAAPAAGGLPAGLTLPPGITLPEGFDPSTLAGLAGGAGGLDLGALLGPGGPDNETPVIIAGYTSTTAKLKAMDAAIATIPATGDAAASITSVITAAKDVIASLKDATTKISAVGTVQLMASTNLQAPGAELTGLFEKTADALVAKKDVIVKAGKKADVLTLGKEYKEVLKGFTDMIEKHLPSLSVQVAQQEHARGLATADKIVAAFS